MTNKQLAKMIADGLIETGVEGGFDAVSCSTAGDYPSIGCSQWEGGRADDLLSMIAGGEKFSDVAYSDLSDEDLEVLSNLLDSEEGQEAQRKLLASDCEEYVEELKYAGLTDDKCIVYCGMWCPTSTYVVCATIGHAEDDGIDINNVEELATYFFNNYAYYANCEEYEEGYQNRSETLLSYVQSEV